MNTLFRNKERMLLIQGYCTRQNMSVSLNVSYGAAWRTG